MKCNYDYEIGEKVLLSEETSWNTSDVMNPLGVVGVVVAKDSERDGGWVYVDWSNTEKGLTNQYRRFDYDFKPVGKGE